MVAEGRGDLLPDRRQLDGRFDPDAAGARGRNSSRAHSGTLQPLGTRGRLPQLRRRPRWEPLPRHQGPRVEAGTGHSAEPHRELAGPARNGEGREAMIPPAVRRILHVDMDAFYASVEQRDDPSLRGRPVAVGGRPEGRGVVAAASYEAREFGVRSALPMARAVRLCSELVIVRPDFTKYAEVSKQVFAIFREVTPLVEPLSLDEAYLDVTENAWGEPLGVTVAKRIKARIRETTQLTASAGVAPNKFLAKIASAWRKPDGLTVIAPERVESFLQKLPVDALWGVGPVTATRLRERGIERLVDVRAADPDVLRDAVGSMADWLLQLAAGEDDRPVEPNQASKS